MNLQSIDKRLMRSAGVILILVAILKLLSAFTHIRQLSEPDPVLGFVSVRGMLLLAGQIELFIGVIIALQPQSWCARYGLLAMCATFTIYRGVGVYSGTGEPCRCLGRASDWLHLTPQQADHFALVLLVMLGSIALMSVLAHARTPGKQLCGGNDGVPL